jgi:hypothetical protein
MAQLRWQRLAPFEDLADLPVKHLDGLANYCRTKVRMGVVEAVHGNIRMLINRGRGYRNPRYLLLKAKRPAVSGLQLLAVLLHSAKIRQTSPPTRTRSLPNRNLDLRYKDFAAEAPGNFGRVGGLEKQGECFF